MSEIFGSTYAEAYDLLYHKKNYQAECDLVEQLFETYGEGQSVHRVLDLGCGTGNHALGLAVRGYEVVGVDRSTPMLNLARKKSARFSAPGKVTFQQGDIRTVDVGRDFDAVLMMFAVLGYQLENADLLQVFDVARKHLRPRGILIFDVWYGPAVLHQRPSQQIRVIPTPKGKILRVASGELDIRRQLCEVHYHLWRLERERLVSETEERHLMRYFFPQELDLLLERTGFARLRLGGFPQFSLEPDETTWNVLAVARMTQGVA